MGTQHSPVLVLAGLGGRCGVSVLNESMAGGAIEGSGGAASSAGDKLMRFASFPVVVSIVGGLLYGADGTLFGCMNMEEEAPESPTAHA